MSRRRSIPAFTLIELLVVVSIIALLIVILLPTLGSSAEQARTTVCTSRLKHIGTALTAFTAESDNRLPQVWLKGPPGGLPVTPVEMVPPSTNAQLIGNLFAGTTGDLPFYGIDEIGPARRPLNPYLGITNAPEEPRPAGEPHKHGDEKFQVEPVLDPSDKGLVDTDTAMALPPDATDAMDRRYELLGTSYVLNESVFSPDPSPALREIGALIPQDFGDDLRQINDGRMPTITAPGFTVFASDGPIQNYNKHKNLAQNWHFGSESARATRSSDPAAVGGPKGYVEANLLFVDLHVGSRIKIREPNYADPDVQKNMNTTPDYTLLPNPDWPLVTPP